MKKMILLLALASLALVGRADDLTVDCGGFTKTYHNITQVKATDATLSFMHDTGAATVFLSRCPVDIQAKYNYNPAKAQVELQAYAADLAQKAQEAKLQAQAARAKEQQEEASAPPAPTGLTPEQIAAIKQQIWALQSDITEKKRISHGDGKGTAGDGYRDIIASEIQQMRDLKAQLPPEKPQ